MRCERRLRDARTPRMRAAIRYRRLAAAARFSRADGTEKRNSTRRRIEPRLEHRRAPFVTGDAVAVGWRSPRRLRATGRDSPANADPAKGRTADEPGCHTSSFARPRAGRRFRIVRTQEDRSSRCIARAGRVRFVPSYPGDARSEPRRLFFPWRAPRGAVLSASCLSTGTRVHGLGLSGGVGVAPFLHPLTAASTTTSTTDCFRG
jgi:hypothetical protein